MNPLSPLPLRAWLALPVTAFLLSGTCAAQDPNDIKPAPTVDPVKGAADPSPLTADERAMLRDQRPLHAPMPPASTRPAAVATATGRVLREVLTDECGDGLVWAVGNTWKASFGAEGFTYVPYFGSAAPRNFPVRFQLQAVQVGGEALALGPGSVQRRGHEVQIAHGAVAERYELRPDQVEQTFVVESDRPGAVDLVLRVDSELPEDRGAAGVQFGNEYGRVGYGDAFVVRGDERVPVATTFADGALTIHVPAALRTRGPLVIDPIITTQTVPNTFPNDVGSPDIAYDVTFDQYLMVWHYVFSATDYDVYSEFGTGNGTPQTGTFGAVDVTTLSHQAPRVANNNAADRFLVVMQRFASSRWQVYGRLRLAGQAVHPILFPISDPNLAGDALAPDVGGDSADSGTADNFLVVWQRDVSTSDCDIHGRIVRVDTSLPGATILLQNSSNSIYALPNVSNSNGNGFATQARWMVVYQFRFSPTDWDVYGCSLAQSGAITSSNQLIDGSVQNDQVPFVSSPNTDSANGNPLFLVTYERQGPAQARACLLSGGMVHQIPPVDLTTSFGFGPFWVRPECDGNRFAILHGLTGIDVSTLAYTGTALVAQDGPTFLYGLAEYPRLCSKRSGGGQRTDYGIAYTDALPSPDIIGFFTYEGRTGDIGVIPHGYACSGLGSTYSGQNNIGETLSFQLSNVGFDIPAWAFGAPSPANYLICPACALGVSTVGVTLLVGPTLTIAIPPQVSLVGSAFAVQGLAFGSGPCIAQFRVGIAYEFKLR